MPGNRRKALIVTTGSYADSALCRLSAPEIDGAALESVLADPRIGDYAVQRLHDAPAADIGLVLEDLFVTARLDDSLLVYFSGHGVKDADGRLYLGMTNTRVARLASTAVSSRFLQEQVERSRSRRVLIILDCCYSGAYPDGWRARAGGADDATTQLMGRGAAVLAASDGIEYAFERAPGQQPAPPAGPSAPNSLFTAALLRGLRTGAADLDRDGLVDVTELYEYVYQEIRSKTRHQTPTFTSRVTGRLFVAYNPSLAPRSASGPVPHPPEPEPPVANADRAALTNPLLEQSDGAATSLVISVGRQGGLVAQMGRRTFLVGAAGLVVRPRLIGGAAVGAGWQLDVAEAHEDPTGFRVWAQDRWPQLDVLPPPPGAEADWQLIFPGGRIFPGSSAAIQVHPGGEIKNGQLLVRVRDPRRLKRFLALPQRSMIIAASAPPTATAFHVLDRQAALRQVRGGMDRREVILSVPLANRLDDLTYGILWASMNLDDSLIGDDLAIVETRNELRMYDRLGASAVSRDLAVDLNPVSRAWLGSDFCARYILSHLAGQPETPLFWTREQTGEEASMWLLVEHKLRYLRRTRYGVPGSPDQATRAFCVPEQVLREAPLADRLLLFLAMVLMEAFDIRVDLLTDPGYAEVEGFVLHPGSRALVANWVRAEGIWHVDSRAGRVDLRQFTDAVRHAGAESVTRAAVVSRRLELLAAYLDIDLVRTVARCRAVARSGWSSLVRPRSRYLSTAGLDLACGYVSSLGAGRWPGPDDRSASVDMT